MNPSLKTISSVIDCDIHEARRFCERVQAQFQGRIPPFDAIAQMVVKLSDESANPSLIAEHLRETGWKTKAKKKSSWEGLQTARHVKRGKSSSSRSLDWVDTKREFTVDESGAIVPESVLEDLRSSWAKRRRYHTPQNPTSGTKQRNNVFARLRKTFTTDEARKAAKKSKGELAKSSPSKKEKPPMLYCPECKCRVRKDRLQKHMKKIHGIEVDRHFIERIERSMNYGL